MRNTITAILIYLLSLPNVLSTDFLEKAMFKNDENSQKDDKNENTSDEDTDEKT